MSAVRLANSNLVYGFSLFLNQVLAMTMKKFFYIIRNYIMLFIQFFIPILFLIITMLMEDLFSGAQDLPSLPISFLEYIQTVTLFDTHQVGNNEFMKGIVAGYKNFFETLPRNHRSMEIAPDVSMSDAILTEYRRSMSNVNLNYMVSTTFNGSAITAWFNNQAFHTAPLTVNLVNNAILRYLSYQIIVKVMVLISLFCSDP